MKLHFVPMVFVSLFLAANTAYAGLPFENGRYYYYTDVEGAYYFEFIDGMFSLYRPAGFPDASSPNKEALPGYPGLYAEHVRGAYSLHQSSGGAVDLSLGHHKFLLLYSHDMMVMLFDISIPQQFPIRLYLGFKSEYCGRSNGFRPPIFSPESREQIRVSSSLEGKTKTGISYEPPFSRMYLSNEWAFRSREDGTEEWIEMQNKYASKWLVMVNGFIYPQDMSYYDKNNRVRSIHIEDADSELALGEVVLEDTANPRFIRIPAEARSSTNLKLTINDVYRGSQYGDTAIGFIGLIVNPTPALEDALAILEINQIGAGTK